MPSAMQSSILAQQGRFYPWPPHASTLPASCNRDLRTQRNVAAPACTPAEPCQQRAQLNKFEMYCAAQVHMRVGGWESIQPPDNYRWPAIDKVPDNMLPVPEARPTYIRTRNACRNALWDVFRCKSDKNALQFHCMRAFQHLHAHRPTYLIYMHASRACVRADAAKTQGKAGRAAPFPAAGLLCAQGHKSQSCSCASAWAATGYPASDMTWDAII